MRSGFGFGAALCLLLAMPALGASDRGTAEEAKAMLEKAIAEVRADEEGALSKFNAGDEGDYRKADLYVFCYETATGTITAHPTLRGQDIRSIKDVNGKALGEEMFATAAEGTIAEIDYMWPRPGTTEPVEKHSFYTRIGDQACGVGYYP
jgi:signal transduction histidine kinase